MSTTSPRVGYKVPDGSDPFLRTDFVTNYGLADKFPGDWICTSGTRPTWGASQAGMKITETDTRRTMLWTGSTWREMLTGPAMWWGSLRPNVMVGKGTTVTYVVGTFTVNRPGALLGLVTTEIGLPSNGYVAGNIRCMIDGSEANWDGTGYGEYFKADHSNSGTVAGQNDYGDTITSVGVRTISAGTHSIGLRVAMAPTLVNTSARVTSIRAMAMFVNGTDR